MADDIVNYLLSGFVALILLYVIYEAFRSISAQSPGFAQIVGAGFVLALFAAAIAWAKKGA